MSDSKFELMSNPDKFCLGKGGFAEQRPRKITYRKYFNARLQELMADLPETWITCL